MQKWNALVKKFSKPERQYNSNKCQNFNCNTLPVSLFKMKGIFNTNNFKSFEQIYYIQDALKEVW